VSKPDTLAARLTLAMKAARVSSTQLQRACKVSAVAVHKWLSGQTIELRHGTCSKAAAFLGVNPAWLNYGRGPRGGKQARAYHELDALLQLRGQLEAGLRLCDSIMRELHRRR